MRFLCTDLENGFRLKTFDYLTTRKKYAVLSHRWGRKEVLLADLLPLCRKDGVDATTLPIASPSEDPDGEMNGDASSEDSEDGDTSSEDSNHDSSSDDSDGRYSSWEDSADGVQSKELKRWCKPRPSDWKRFKKVVGCCWRARKDGYKYIWIDTCCIDQKSSSELSESINSMYSLYAKSAVCYVYLHDVLFPTNPQAPNSAFRQSIWFTRGWTLQELIAPSNMIFLTTTWDVIDGKAGLATTIQEITDINYGVLCGITRVEDMSVAERMSWASNRRTMKVEDRAYSLLGIFGVNMTTIYGEGEKAFQRLQFEIMRQSNDHSIFAWGFQLRLKETNRQMHLLASSPDAFSDSAGIITIPHFQFSKQWGYEETVPDVQKTTSGVVLELPVLRFPHTDVYIAVLGCKTPSPHFSPNRYMTVGLALNLDSEGYYEKLCHLCSIDRMVQSGRRFKIEQIHIRNEMAVPSRGDSALPRNLVVPPAYEVVLKTYTLRPLLDAHYVLLDELHTQVQMLQTHHGPGHRWSYETLRRRYEYRWAENDITLDKDLVLTVQSGIESDDCGGLDAGQDILDSVYITPWARSGEDFGLEILVDALNPCAYRGYTLKLPYFHHSKRIEGQESLKPHHYFSMDSDDGSSVLDIIFTRTSVTAEIVSYDLEFMVRDAPTSLPPEASKSSEEPEPDRLRRSPVEWVPTFMGIVPNDAYEIRQDGEDSYITRAAHKGTVTPGLLHLPSLYAATIPLSEVSDTHIMYEYDILIGSPSFIRWAPVCRGFELEALRGAKHVDGGRDKDGRALYLVRASIKEIEDYNKKSYRRALYHTSGNDVADDEGDYFKYSAVCVGRLPFFDTTERMRFAKRYSILVYR